MRDKYLFHLIASLLVVLSIYTLVVVIRPFYWPYLPIRRASPAQVDIPHRANFDFDPAIRFLGYAVDTNFPIENDTLPVTLFWQARAATPHDYLVRLCLLDAGNTPVTCRYAYPANGQYPTRAWEVGYVVRDEQFIPLPDCLSPGRYRLHLSMLPLKDTTAAISLADDPVTAELQLTSIAIQGQQKIPRFAATDSPPMLAAQAGHAIVCFQDDCTKSQGDVLVSQKRQGVTVMIHQTAATGDVSLSAVDGAGSWPPVAAPTAYTCPDGSTVETATFISDGSVGAGRYAPQAGDVTFSELTVRNQAHTHNFAEPDSLTHLLNLQVGPELHLIGYNADLSARKPGDVLDVATYWQVRQTTDRPLYLSVHMLDSNVAMWSQDDHPLGGGYLSVLWVPGEIISDTSRLRLPPDMPPGQYRLELGVYDFSANQFDFLPITATQTMTPLSQNPILGTVRVRHPLADTPPAHRLDTTLADDIALTGYRLEGTLADGLHVTLYWRAARAPAADYTVFTQLVGPDGVVWAQQDNFPQAGRFPTGQWPDGATVLDDYALLLREGAPPGEYRLLVGMYNWQTGQRLPAVDAEGRRWPDDAIMLATVSR